jgi:uncharacterized repeat protein (TIGR03803 family)
MHEGFGFFVFEYFRRRRSPLRQPCDPGPGFDDGVLPLKKMRRRRISEPGATKRLRRRSGNSVKHLPKLVAACLSAALLAACGGSSDLSPSTPTSVTSQITASQFVNARSASQHSEPSFSRQPLTGNGYKSLYSFKGGADGADPAADLISYGGTLYSTTLGGGYQGCGGSGGCGTVFAISTSGSERVLHDFDGGSDGSAPYASLIAVRGALYGTTSGMNENFSPGTVFRVSTSGKEQILFDFNGSTAGGYPEAGLTEVNGRLFGTTSCGGTVPCEVGYGGDGTVFKISTSGKETTLYTFQGGTDGANPMAGLIAVKKTLYGTTSAGGTGCSSSGGCGTVFAISASGKERVLYRFKGGKDGSDPQAGLIVVNGVFYGTTYSGGKSDYGGTVFSVTTAGKERVLHSFSLNGSDGFGPEAGLIAVNGALYGTTSAGGGSDGLGTVFKVSTSGKEHVLHTFNENGYDPVAGLIDVNGMLYGTTEYGGSFSRGTVFRISP